uniref:G-protein coupled receptors family 1 profile domain-containing protein n=1 Tax=Sander lucioperca TaxID=283035 RepID=A0A8D0CY32_SANLU
MTAYKTLLVINTSLDLITNFFILGFPGLSQEYCGPVSALLLVLFLAIAVGNIFILVFVKCERSLHKPTYLIFCHLALSDLIFGTVTLPKIISKYWFDDSIISFYGCFVQMYFVHFLGALFTNNTVSVLCGISWILPMSWMVGIVIDTLRLPYCNSNIITQCYCDHLAIAVLGCEDIRENLALALGGAMFFLMLPLGFIIFSYFVIIVAVMRMTSSNSSRMMALSTCLPQIIITFLYFMPRCFVYLANFVGFTFSVPVRIVIVMLYSILPAAINPLIYCFKTKDIKEHLKKKLVSRKINSSTTTG